MAGIDKEFQAWVGHIEKPVEGSKLQPFPMIQHGKRTSNIEEAIREAKDAGMGKYGWIEEPEKPAHIDRVNQSSKPQI